MENENYILIEDDIVKATGFNAFISGTNDILVDAADLFGKRDLKKINPKTNYGSQETHAVQRGDFMQVKKSSDVSDI